MTPKLFVGGFPYETSERELAALFGACGEVKSVKILLDRDTRRSRGLAFVEMATPEAARAAIAKLDGSSVGSRAIFVTEAREKESAAASPQRPAVAERRSGKDRRKGWGPLPGGQERREDSPQRRPWREKPSFGKKKPWSGKPAFGEKKPWGGKPAFGEKKPWHGKPGDKPKKPDAPGGPRKKWGAGGPGGETKWNKPRKFGRRPF